MDINTRKDLDLIAAAVRGGAQMKWSKLLASLCEVRVPIITDLYSASWPNWREGLKEIFVILFFSLMPLWLGLLIVEIVTISDKTSSFAEEFASNSDLGILSASLLGPLLYMMFREEGEAPGDRLVPRFPSGLWFTMIILACCIVATVIYCFTYLSGIHLFFDQSGVPIKFVNSHTVALISWSLLIVVVLLSLFACTIRNSMETEPPTIMRGDTRDYVAEFEAAQGDHN